MDSDVEPGFAQRVESLVAQIPQGRVMTYGQLAALCGNARAARIVGGIAHFGDPALPWQRVVNKSGGLAAGYPGGRAAHAAHLQAEGVEAVDGHVDVHALLWWPAGVQGASAETRNPLSNTAKGSKSHNTNNGPKQQGLF